MECGRFNSARRDSNWSIVIYQNECAINITSFIDVVPSEVVLLSELSDPVVLPAPGLSVLVLVDAVPAQAVTVRVELDVPDVVTLPTCRGGLSIVIRGDAGRIVISEAFLIFRIYIKYEIFGNGSIQCGETV